MATAGQSLGPYLLLKRLGAGAMGEVWKARDERLGRLVAIKTLPTKAVATDDDRALMLREARAAAGVPHANVVTLYDIYSEDEGDFLVMELVEGQTLSELLLEHGSLSPKQALEYLLAVCGALVSAHERGIIHRDIKAANVMLTENGTIKVLDFGLAKLRESELEVGELAIPARTTGTRLALDATAAVTTGPETSSKEDSDVALAGTVAPASGTGDAMALAGTMAPTSGTGEAAALAGTMASTPASRSGQSSQPLGTLSGDLIGTPLYMSPEQVLGERPDAVSEVFTVGILGYELLCGKTPYSATTMDGLFKQILDQEMASLPDSTPPAIVSCLETATTLDREGRYPTMAELEAELRTIYDNLYQPKAPRRVVLLAMAVALAAVVSIVVYVATRPEPVAPKRPGDVYVEQARREYEVFYNDKARSSLLAALKHDPDHPRAHAYTLLFGAAKPDERAASLQAGKRILQTLAEGDDRTLLRAAVAFAENGATAGEEVFLQSKADNREIAFWSAELAFRARDFQRARDGFDRLYAEEETSYRGRIYDHYSAVLMFFGEADQAVAVGKAYVDAFPGEPDALGVYATTSAAVGELDRALKLATEAADLNPAEDTFAGLGKVLAMRGQLGKARAQFEKSMALANDQRRPLRRAALGLLFLADDKPDDAQRIIEPCLDGGEDASSRGRGPCLWVASLVFPDRVKAIAGQLDALADQASARQPVYGFPRKLANLVRARAEFFGGGCILPGPSKEPPKQPADVDALLEDGRDLAAIYHVPFFSTYARCERAALALSTGDADKARKLLEPVTAQPHTLLLYADIAAEADDLERDEVIERARSSWPDLDPGCAFAERLRGAE